MDWSLVIKDRGNRDMLRVFVGLEIETRLNGSLESLRDDDCMKSSCCSVDGKRKASEDLEP